MLAYEEWGTATPWIFLHGFPLSRRMWVNQRPLAEEIRLIMPDLPGHGESSAQGGESIEAMARSVLELADHLGVRRFGLCGFSLGGYVAFAILRQAKERVANLALVDTQATPDSPEALENRLDLASRVGASGIELLATAFVPKLLSHGGRDDPRLSAQLEDLILANDPKAMAVVLRAMGSRKDASDLLPTIACPTLVVVGSEDRVTPIEKARELATRIRRSTLSVIPRAGHAVPIEAPHEFNDEFARWVSGKGAGTATQFGGLGEPAPHGSP